MKKYINIAFIYSIAAMVSGVFYREFTKFYSFSGKTTLAFTHLHFFVLGTVIFLIIAALTQITNLESQNSFKIFLKLYNIALPFMVIMFYVRGIFQVLQTQLSSGMSAAVSGVSGIAHILMAVSIVMLFSALRKSEKN